MSEPADELQVVLEDDPNTQEPAVEVAKPDDAAPEPPKPPETDAALDELKGKLAAETTARQDAERRAVQEAQRRQAAQTETHESHLALVSNAIGAVKAERENLKAKLKEAISGGDLDAQLELQDQLTTKAAELLQLEQGKAALENAPKPQPQPMPQGDMLEQICAGLSAPSAAWLRQHPEYASSQQKLNAMIKADGLAKDLGHTPDTPDYFRAVERALGIEARRETPTAEEPMSSASKPSDTAPPAAPPSRGTEINGQRPRTVRLTAAQREAADIAGISYVEYAKQVLALEGETKH